MRFLDRAAHAFYLFWLLFALAPIGAIAYGLASVAGSVWANLKSGWRDHK